MTVMNPNGLRVLIIGGVACGPKAASRLRRLLPQADVTMIERGGVVSYGACGLPYYVEGMFPDVSTVMETPVGIKRTPAFFEKVKGFKTFTRTEALHIDRREKIVRVKNLDTAEERDLAYDRLVLATGSRPLQPPVSGLDLPNVFFMRHPDDASALMARLEGGTVRRAVIVGAGYIGVEMAEALAARGLDVTMVEMANQIMPQFLDFEMAALVAKHMRQKGVRLALGQKVTALEGDAAVAAVRTETELIPADVVVVGVGVRPNDELARQAGLQCALRGGVMINEYCQTSDPDIYAGGDCVVNQYVDPIHWSALYVPLGSTANKHGRVIADHIAGLSNPFPGVTATGVCRVFDFTVGRTGLTERQARELDPEVETAIWAGPSHPHYVPESKPLIIKMVASRRHRRLLGVQVVGSGDGAKRLDVAASALAFGATVDQLAHIDLGYAPPYAPPLDPIAVTAHLMANKFDGIARGVSPLETKARLDRGDDIILLDVRTPAEYDAMRFPSDKVIHIPLGMLRERAGELPRDKDILAFCKVSMRGYEAQRILNGVGFDRVWFIEGGLVGWPFEVWTAA